MTADIPHWFAACQPSASSKPERGHALKLLYSAIFLLAACTVARAQGNYEIQVYGAETRAPGTTMVEAPLQLHRRRPASQASTASPPPITPSTKPSKSPRASTTGRRSASTSSPASRAASARSGSATTSAPVCACRKTGAGRSASACPWRSATSARSSRPTPGPGRFAPSSTRQAGRWYFAVNPALERTWHGPDVNLGLDFSPAVKISYDFTKKVTGGIEYYADYGSITNIATPPQSAAADLPRHRPERLARLGDQLRRRHRPHRRHRSLDRQGHRRPPLRLGPQTPHLSHEPG